MNNSNIRARIEIEADNRQIDKALSQATTKGTVRIKDMIDRTLIGTVKTAAKAGIEAGKQYGKSFESQSSRFLSEWERKLKRLSHISLSGARQIADRFSRRGEELFFRSVFGRLPPGRYENHRFAADVRARMDRLRSQDIERRVSGMPILAARSRRIVPSPIREGYQRIMAGAGAVYLAERTFRMFDRILIDPMIRLGKTFIQLNEDASKFRIMASTSAGGLGRARELDIELARLNRGLPIDRASMRESAGMYFSIPGLAGATALSSPQQIAQSAAAMAEVQSRLKLLDPTNQDPRSAMLAMRELAEGDYRSIQRRFGLSREAIARAAGVEPRDISNDPQAALRGVQNLTSVLIDKNAVDQLNNLPSQIAEHIRQSVRDFVVKIGDQGSFKAVQNRLGNLRDSVYSYMDSPASTEQAKRMSEDATRIIDNLTAAGKRFIHALAGDMGDNSAESVANSAAAIFENFSKLTDVLPSAAEQLGEFLRATGAFTSDLIDQVERMRSNMSARGVVGSYFSDLQLRLHPSMAREKELQVMSDTLARIDPRLQFGVERQYGSSFSKYGEAFEPLPITGPGRRGLLIQQLIDQLDGMRASKRFNEPYSTALHSRRAVESYLDANFKGWRDRLANLGESEKINIPAGVSRVPQALQDFIGSEETGPNFQAIAQAVAARADIEGRRGSLRDLSDRRAALFGTNFGSESDPVRLAALYQRMSAMQREFESKAVPAIQSGQLFGSITDDPETRKLTDAAVDILEKSRARFRIAAESLDSILIGAARNFGEELQQSVGDAPARARSIVLDSVASGMTSLGRDVQSILVAAGRSIDASEFGIGAMDGERANVLLRDRTRAAIEAKIDEAQFGSLDESMDSAGVRRAFSRRPGAELAARNALKQARAIAADHRSNVDRQLEAYRADPSELNQVNLATAQTQYSQLMNEMDALSVAADRGLATIVEFSVRGREALEQNLGQGLADLVLGFGSLEDAAKSFARDLVQIFMQSQARNLAQIILGDFGNPSQGDPTGMRGGGGLLGGLLSGMMGNFMGGGDSYSPTAPAVSSAKGNVFSGGLKIPSFSKGGIVGQQGPVFALVGDASGSPTRGSPEAVLPLVRAQGKLGVAAHGVGGGQAIVNVTVVDNHREAAAHIAQQQMRTPTARNIIIDTWADSYMSGNKAFKVTRAKK